MTERAHDRLPRLLLGEDHRDVRVVLAQVFAADGFDVVEASTGIELLRWLAPGWFFEDEGEDGGFDVVVSDVRIPGFTALEVLSGLPIEGRPPVVLITAFGGEAVEREARRLGVVAVFRKPFDLDDLRTTVSIAAASAGDHGPY